MDLLTKAAAVIRTEIEAVEAMLERLDTSFEDAVRTLKESIDSRGKIIVVGVGKSGNIGKKIAATLNSTGATAVALSSQNALHGDLGIVSDGDAVLILSYSGETPELVDLLPFLKRFQVKIITLTGAASSTLAQHSNIVIDTSVEREACPLNLAPTSSSTAMLVMGDALAMVLLETRGFTEEEFAKYHPGGALGRALLTKVSDVMRTGEHLATVPPDATVHDAIAAMSQARVGAAVVVNPDGKLAGIFTHGDFARSYESDPAIGQRPVADFMTPDPVAIEAHHLAAEAVKTIGDKRIDDIVVVDPDGKPVGLIDSQDLARLNIV